MSPRSRAGFTLWDLAVVVISLTIIAAVLFPLIQKAPITSRRASCQSNMKQFGLAMVMYTQDSDGTYPQGANAAGNGWAGQLYKFTKANGLYRCPSDVHYRYPSDVHDGTYISYAQNRNLVKQSVDGIAIPAATVELYESTTLNCDPSAHEAVSATGLSAPQDSTRHDASTFALNYLTADGHVKYLTPGQVSGGPNAVSPKKRGAAILTFAIK